MNYWQRGKCLPDSNDRLAIVARMSNDEWTANREVIAEFFEVTSDGWTHKRVERDLIKVKGISNAGKIAGMASAKARKEKSLNDRSTTVPTEPQRKGNHTDTDTDTDTKQIQKQTQKKPAASGFESEIYSKYPRKVGRGAALKAITRAVQRLDSGEADDKLHPADSRADFLRDAVEAFADSPAGKAGEYTPHPATWFNQSRYLDDPKEWQRNSNGGNNGANHGSGFKNKYDLAREQIDRETLDQEENPHDGGATRGATPLF